jgi:hypothetical protein
MILCRSFGEKARRFATKEIGCLAFSAYFLHSFPFDYQHGILQK